MKYSDTLNSKNDRSLLILCFVLFAALIAVLIPVLFLSFFAHTALDDCSFGWRNAAAMRDGRSLFLSVINTVKQYYFGWQGTFSAVALMSLVPSLFGEQYYFLTTFILVGMLCFSSIKLCRTLSVRVLKASSVYGWIVSLTLLILTFCLLPSPCQGLYWWNGAIFYTFFYSLMLLLIDQLFFLFLSDSSSSLTGHFILSAILSFIISGGNYVTALLTLELLVLYSIIIAVKKRKHLPFALIVLFVFLVGFALSIFAPGNAIRMANETGGLGPVQAVIKSLLQSFKDFYLFFNPTVYICLLIGIIVFLGIVPKIKFGFHHPILFQLLAFLLYASQHAPHFYAVGTPGPERMQNIFFYTHLWFLFLSVFYWTGFIAKRTSFTIPRNVKRGVAVILAVFLVGFASAQCIRMKALPAQIVQAARDGSVELFDEDMDARIAVLEDPTVREVRFAPLSSKPKLLFIWDCDPDPKHWGNIAAAYFYDKDSVRQISEG